MITCKTHSEILAMWTSARCLWYKTLPLEEKEEAMKIVETTRRVKISKNNPMKRPEHRARMMGKNNPMKRPEVRIKHKDAMNQPEIRARMKGENNPMYGKTGENSPSWRGGKSFEPYCHLFNDKLKESIRNRDNRTCVLCGKGEIQNGQRLSVHHIDSDKMQGCNGVPWYLCALCKSCNNRPDTIEKEFLIVTGGRSVR